MPSGYPRYGPRDQKRGTTLERNIPAKLAWRLEWDPDCKHRWFVVSAPVLHHKNWDQTIQWVKCALCGGTSGENWTVKAPGFYGIANARREARA